MDLKGNDDGTTRRVFRCERSYNVLESCSAVSGDLAFVYAEDGHFYAIE